MQSSTQRQATLYMVLQRHGFTDSIVQDVHLRPHAQLPSADACAPAVDVARALRTAAALVLCSSEAAGLLNGRKASLPNPGTCNCLKETYWHLDVVLKASILSSP